MNVFFLNIMIFLSWKFFYFAQNDISFSKTCFCFLYCEQDGFLFVGRTDLQVKLYTLLTGSNTALLLFPGKTLVWAAIWFGVALLYWRQNMKLKQKIVSKAAFILRSEIWFRIASTVDAEISNSHMWYVSPLQFFFQRRTGLYSTLV